MNNTTPHYQVRPYFGRFAVVYPLPGGKPGSDWAALCDFRTQQGAELHAAWLNSGLTGHRPQRDPAVSALLSHISALAAGGPMATRNTTTTAAPQQASR